MAGDLGPQVLSGKIPAMYSHRRNQKIAVLKAGLKATHDSTGRPNFSDRGGVYPDALFCPCWRLNRRGFVESKSLFQATPVPAGEQNDHEQNRKTDPKQKTDDETI